MIEGYKELIDTAGSIGALLLVAVWMRQMFDKVFGHTIPRITDDFKQSLAAQRSDFREELKAQRESADRREAMVMDELRTQRVEVTNRLDKLAEVIREIRK